MDRTGAAVLNEYPNNEGSLAMTIIPIPKTGTVSMQMVKITNKII